MLSQFKNLIDHPKLPDILRKDSNKKSHIKTLQQLLYELGFGEELQWKKYGADGDFGGATAKAIRAFAAKNEVETDGESVSPELATALFLRYQTVKEARNLQTLIEEGKVEDTLFKGSGDRESVRALQKLLFNLKLGDILGGIDGLYGNGTADAVAAFAKKENIDTDGKTVSSGIAAKILDRFSPFLGKGWKTAKTDSPDMPIANRGSKGEYHRIFPFTDRDTKKIQKELRHEHKFNKQLHEIPGDDFSMEYFLVTRKDRDASYYYHKKVDKQQIVLHFTTGKTPGDLRTLSTKNNHVSTAFLIERDGAVYKMFPASFWSYHLGRGAVGGNPTMSKRSIGIEISNWGPLREDGRGGLVTWDAGHWYCNLDDTEAYIRLEQPYRGAHYFASITPEQYESTIVLLRYLTKTFGIPAQFLPKGKREALFPNGTAARNFKGICCHTNYRASGKWDLSEEAFDWDRVIEGVNSPSFIPTLGAGVGSRSLFGPPMMTEDELIEDLQDLDPGNQNPDAYGEDGPEVEI